MWSKESRHKRGYGTRWYKLRTSVLKRDRYLCQQCKRAGRLTQATEVDHVIPKSMGGTDKADNLASICAPCHKLKTACESNGKDYSAIGYDEGGYPVDPDHHWVGGRSKV